jgi:uncharacterized membrane protein
MPNLHPSRDVNAILRDGFKLDIGARVQEGIELFKPRMVELIAFGAIAFVATFVISLIAYRINRYLGLLIINCVVMPLVVGGLLRYLFDAMKGRSVSFNTFFTFDDKSGPVLIAGALAGLIVAIGHFLLVLPGVIASFLLIFTLPLVVDRVLDPVEAVQTSFKVVMKNPVEVLLLCLVCAIVTILGLFVVGFGLAGCIMACSYAHVFGLTGVDADADASAEPPR